MDIWAFKMARRVSKVVRPLAKGQITIPAEFRQKLGIDANTLLDISLVEGKLEIIPIRIRRAEPLREYTDDDIQQFLEADKIDAQTAGKVKELLSQGRI